MALVNHLIIGRVGGGVIVLTTSRRKVQRTVEKVFNLIVVFYIFYIIFVENGG